MKYTASIKENHIFRRIYSRGKSAASSLLVVYFRRNGQRGNRLGITVSTKVGKAVVRNKIRRRLREIYRLHEEELISGVDIILVSRVRASEAGYRELERDFLRLADKLGLVRRQG